MLFVWQIFDSTQYLWLLFDYDLILITPTMHGSLCIERVEPWLQIGRWLQWLMIWWPLFGILDDMRGRGSWCHLPRRRGAQGPVPY